MNSTSSPRRILYCENNTDGTIGGSHYCLLNLVERLDTRRYAPVTMFYQEHALIPKFSAVSEVVVRPPHAPWKVSTAMTGALGRLLKLPLLLVRRSVNFWKLMALVREEARWLREQRIALVHLNNAVTRHHDWMLAAMMSGIPCVSHERGMNEPYTAVDRFLARRLALIVPMARWMRDEMVARGVPPDNIRVMYDGLDPSRLVVTREASAMRQEWNVGPEQPVIGIVGNIRAWKGQEVVVRAMSDIVKHRPNVVCFFVGASTPGDQPYVDKLNALVRDFGLEANVRFTGYQNRVPDFVNMMSVVIHASVEPEPFGMVVLEAMALRKPVVGSAAGGVIEMVVEGVTGYTFPPGDPRVLAARVLELIAAPEKACAMGEAGYRRVVQDFPLDRYVSDIQEAYDRILDPK
ncbi:glycosyltransferase family 4 protein [Luteitalea sp.]|uniref:glycosyltransferase family 4 protein n=1 Tax=Luteitalea sp. TaxID=2004800 RepID=UPI0025C48375|nr:glycosyltransferase family 4 protein [Luteitalea sp.]